MDDQKKKIKELNENDTEKPSYKALFFIECMKGFFVLLVLFVIWTGIKAIYDTVLDFVNPRNISRLE